MKFKNKEHLPLTFPTVSPIKAAKDYYISKAEAKRALYTPLWDQSRESAIIELFDVRRNKAGSEKSLERKRQEGIRIRRVLNQRWQYLRDKELHFKEVFQRFNKFIRENQEKRDRAEKKIAEELALQERRVKETNSMKEKYMRVWEIKNSMETRLKEYRMYEDYLEAAAKSSNNLKNVNDVLFRYESLLDAKCKLSEKQAVDMNAIESARTEMAKLLEEKNLVLVGQGNFLANLLHRYNKAKTKALLWETTVGRIQDISSSKLAEIQQVKRSCYNTYLTMCQRQRVDSKFSENDSLNQLVFIKTTMYMLRKVNKELFQKSKSNS